MTTTDGGRSQHPTMKMGGTIPLEGRDKIDEAARLMATMEWSAGGKPAVGDRAGIRDLVLAAAREGLGRISTDKMLTTAGEIGVDPAMIDPGEVMAPPAGVFRIAVEDFDRADPVVAESIMDIIQRATDDELSRQTPGAPDQPIGSDTR